MARVKCPRVGMKVAIVGRVVKAEVGLKHPKTCDGTQVYVEWASAKGVISAVPRAQLRQTTKQLLMKMPSALAVPLPRATPPVPVPSFRRGRMPWVATHPPAAAPDSRFPARPGGFFHESLSDVTYEPTGERAAMGAYDPLEMPWVVIDTRSGLTQYRRFRTRHEAEAWNNEHKAGFVELVGSSPTLTHEEARADLKKRGLSGATVALEGLGVTKAEAQTELNDAAQEIGSNDPSAIKSMLLTRLEAAEDTIGDSYASKDEKVRSRRYARNARAALALLNKANPGLKGATVALEDVRYAPTGERAALGATYTQHPQPYGPAARGEWVVVDTRSGITQYHVFTTRREAEVWNAKHKAGFVQHASSLGGATVALEGFDVPVTLRALNTEYEQLFTRMLELGARNDPGFRTAERDFLAFGHKHPALLKARSAALDKQERAIMAQLKRQLVSKE